MRLLVTGAGGYVGGITAWRLKAAGHEVVAVDDFSEGHLGVAERVSARVQACDIADGQALAAILRRERPEAVLHFAARSKAGESVREPAGYYRANVTGTFNLLEAMRQAVVRDLVFSSTAAVYGEPRAFPIEETAPILPVQPYGRTKAACEAMICDFAAAYGLRAVCLRYFNAAGAADALGERHDPETHLIPLVLRVAAGRAEAVELYGRDYPTPDGTCIRDYVHVADIAEAHVLALERIDRVVGTAINLGSERGHSVAEVIETARRVTERTIAVRETARRPGDPARLVASAGRAREILGWRPGRSSLEEIISSAWDFLRRESERGRG